MSNIRLMIKEKVMTLGFIGLSVFIFSFSNAAYVHNNAELVFCYDNVLETVAPTMDMQSVLDTVPQKSKMVKKIITIDDTNETTIIKQKLEGDTNKDRDIELEMENGEISKMVIDGKEIDPKDYDAYMEEFNVNENINIDADGKETITRTYSFESDENPEGDKNKEVRIERHIIGSDISKEELNKMLEGLEGFEGLEGLDGLDALDGESIRIKILEGDGEMLFFDEDSDMDLESLKQDMQNLGDNARITIKRFEDGQIITEDIEGGSWIEEGDHDLLLFPKGGNNFKFDSGKTVSDKIAYKLNNDGLLEINQNNKIELSGKHLKINGDKQPKNIFSKYKRYYEEIMGMELTKGSKIEFEAKGKNQEIRSF